jgi:hypothetical protein
MQDAIVAKRTGNLMEYLRTANASRPDGEAHERRVRGSERFGKRGPILLRCRGFL